MPKRKIKTIKVATGVSPTFLEETLTQDITPLESLFDLIDNSIDAARDHLLKNSHPTDAYGLPADYSGYSIHIRIDKDSIRVLDNGLGMDEEVLSQKAFRVAELSNHSFGIGHYGLGLKRSLLKFGTTYGMAADTGEIAFAMRFDSKHFGGQPSKALTADQYPSRGRRKVLFSVSDLKTSVKYEIKDKEWLINAIKQLSVRYALYVSKGLKITIRSIPHGEFKLINGSIPSLRENTKVRIKGQHLSEDGVDIFIDAGIHGEHLFKEEENYSEPKIRSISHEYGLYFICNDRVIVAASSSEEHGWKTNRWHSEYNGFVCLVRFISKDARKLPWNTAKTALKTDSTLFLHVKEKLQPIADSYRGEIKRKYPPKKRAGETDKTIKQATTATSTKTSGRKNINEAPSSSSVKSAFEEMLHPLILEHSYKQYQDGHYRDAVLNSIVAVFDLIRQRTGLDSDGTKLIGEAFGLERPRLIFSELKTESGCNDQKGFMQILSGAYQGIRNPKAHSLRHDLDKTKAAQYLIFASLLARRVHEAKSV